MIDDCCIEDWLDVLILGVSPGDASRHFEATDWKEYYCVLERDPLSIRIFLDEQEYDDYRNFPSCWSPQRSKTFFIGLNSHDRLSRRSTSLGDLTSTVNSTLSQVTVFRRRLSSGLGGFLAFTGLDQRVRGSRSLKVERRKNNTYQRSDRSKSGIFISQSSVPFDQEEDSATTTDSIDLAVNGEVDVRAVHPSIIGHQHCFVVSNSVETKYFSCRSLEEMSKWIMSVKKALDPSRDLECRTDINLSLWIVEAKGLANKKRYFCELLLDNVSYAKTSGKQQKNDTLFWGEQFVFEDLPDLSLVQINIYKDGDKKKKKDKPTLLGTIDIPSNSISLGHEIETWYPISMGTATTRPNEGSSLRIRAKYQRNLILPLGIYNELLEFLKNNYSSLCHFLEPVLSAKAKDEIAKCLIRILQACGKAKEFLIDIVVTEMEKSSDDNLLFRGNSFATKAMDYYMKMVGEEYLEQTLGNFVKSVYKFEEDCEVDPSRITTNQLEPNQENIKAFVEKAWNHIVCSAEDFPRELVDIFSEVRNAFTYISSKASCLKLISGTVFLRFLVPAILSPSLFGLAQEYPDEQTSRTLTLIAKVIQNLANGLRFDQSKEGYLEFMNDFIDEEKRSMRELLKNISTRTVVNDPDYNGCIDLGKELSAMQNALNEQIDKLDKEALSQLSPLQFVLESLNDTCQNPDAVGVFNPNSLILSKHTLSENLYKKLATKTPVDHKLDHSKRPSAVRNKPEYQDVELSDGRENATRNIIIKETKKRNQRYYDMRAGGVSRDSSDRSSESPRSSRNGQVHNESTPANDRHVGKRKPYNRKVDQKSRAKNNQADEVRSPHPSAKRDFPTSDLGEDFLSSGEGNVVSLPPLQKLTVHYVNPSISGKSSNSSGSKWTGSDYGSLPRNFERLHEEGKLGTNDVNSNSIVHGNKLVDEVGLVDDVGVTPLTESSRNHISHGNKHLARSLEDMLAVHSDPESSRARARALRTRSMIDGESGRMIEVDRPAQNKTLEVERNWKTMAEAPGSPILRRIEKFKRPSVSSSSSGSSMGPSGSSMGPSGSSMGQPTSSRETLEKDPRGKSTNQSKAQDMNMPNNIDVNNEMSEVRNTNQLQDYPTNVTALRRELEETKSRLFEKQKELNEERVTSKKRQTEIEDKLRRELDLKDRELRAVHERLGQMEQKLMDQQNDLEGTLKAKDVINQAQERRIKSLNTDYNKLLEALNQLQKTPSIRTSEIRITDNL